MPKSLTKFCHSIYLWGRHVMEHLFWLFWLAGWCCHCSRLFSSSFCVFVPRTNRIFWISNHTHMETDRFKENRKKNIYRENRKHVLALRKWSEEDTETDGKKYLKRNIFECGFFVRISISVHTHKLICIR